MVAVMAEANIGIHISLRTCCDELGVLAASVAAAVKIFSSLKTFFFLSS
jgi:hypothetical protein